MFVRTDGCSAAEKYDANVDANTLKLFKLLRIFRLVKLLRLFRVSRLLHRYQNQLIYYLVHQRRASTGWSFLSHWMGCHLRHEL